jgi:hypothetical protein
MGFARFVLSVATVVAAFSLPGRCLLPGRSLLADAPATDPAQAASGRAEVTFGQPEVTLCGEPAPPRSLAVCGFSAMVPETGPQIAFTERPPTCLACVGHGEDVEIVVAVRGLAGPVALSARVTARCGGGAEASMSLEGVKTSAAVAQERTSPLRVSGKGNAEGIEVRLRTSGAAGESAIEWREVRLSVGDRSFDVPLVPPACELGEGPPPVLAALRRPIERALIEWDWRMQDGIDTERVPSTYAAAVERTLSRGDALIRDLQAKGVSLTEETARWRALRREWEELSSGRESQADAMIEDLWRRVHALRREIVFRNPLARVGPILFVKQVPGAFSHQLTQYYGADARPGGGVFVLDAPGESMGCRQLAADALPLGSYQHPEVSFDGRSVLFSYCHVEKTPDGRHVHGDRRYHLYEMDADGSHLRQLTDGPFDDFSPRYLPGGKILFVSTRRGGFHRCGRGPCPVYTLALAEADGSDPHPISFHETHEWDPCVLHDGRVIYTRWDYVDRHAVFYEQLWTVRPDGSDVRIFYGNNTFHPVGVWEASPVPRSHRVMATAAAHHAMTAGSIILLDVTRGIDGLEPITRLTPDALFPESEAPVIRETGGHWHAPVGVTTPPPKPAEAERWPGHCYRSPFPLSENYFLAAYSYDALIGEPTGNPANMFGIYLVDAFGNKELLYRDLNIASLWPTPLRARTKPPVVASVCEQSGQQGDARARQGDGGDELDRRGSPDPAEMPDRRSPRDGETCGRAGGSVGRPATTRAGSIGRPATTRGDANDQQRDESDEQGGPAVAREGAFFLQNVYESWPQVPRGTIERLRIVQVLPKSTPHINNPPVGMANASPGKQVLGTVPVEPDGSAYFRAPAGIPLAFQALDERGQAVQIMRSVTYLQPGERCSCVGCHEPRTTAPRPGGMVQALTRPPSDIQPGPEGSNPLSYPILVQPVLDKHCVRCHNPEKPEGKVVLTGEPQGRYTVSYNALAPLVPYSAWGGRPGDFRQVNSEPLTQPEFFGARGSELMKLLLAGHEDVSLTEDEIARLATWMDANALFYGTFDPADQARQQHGERIAGPAVE